MYEKIRKRNFNTKVSMCVYYCVAVYHIARTKIAQQFIIDYLWHSLWLVNVSKSKLIIILFLVPYSQGCVSYS